MAEEKITVVVPVYNREKLVERTLESIRRQDVRPLRIVIVDNCSQDSSLEVCRRWADLHSNDEGLSIDILQESRRGPAAARHRGMVGVESEWVAFFDSDDEMEPGILRKALELGDEADMVYWKLEHRDLKDQVRMTRFGTKDQFRRHMYNSMFCTISYMVRNRFIRTAGGWDPEEREWDDWELGVRLLLHAPRLAALEETGARIFSQVESVTGLDFSSRVGRWEHVLDKAEQDIITWGGMLRERWGLTKEAALEMVDYRRVILAAHYAREGKPKEGRHLLETTLEKRGYQGAKRRILKIIYTYTRLGGRGAYYLWR